MKLSNNLENKTLSDTYWYILIHICMEVQTHSFLEPKLKYNLENYNPGHNILALFNNLVQVQMSTSKTILDI